MNYEIKFAKVTNAGRLSDRFLNCQHIAAEDFSQPSGEIFTLIEILSPWLPSAQVGQAIVKNLTSGFYASSSTSNLANFEGALKKVNENLADITQNGETEWIGNLNSVLLAVLENNIHLSSTGSAEAYMFRDGKINHLTEGLSNVGELHPLKTFVNVVSGQLKSNDKILITNKNLLDHLSLESIRQILTLNDPSTAAMQITRLLKKSKARNVNLIILGVYSKEELSKNPVSPQETVYYLDKASESFLNRTANLWQKVLPVFKIFGSGIGRVFSKIFKKSPHKSDSVPPNDASKDQFHREFLDSDGRDDLLKDEEINYSPDLYVHYYKEQKSVKKSRLLPIFQGLKNALKAFGRLILATYRDKSRRKYLFVAAGVVIILVISLFAVFHSQSSRIGNLEAQKILDEAIAAQKDGLGKLSNGDQEGGKNKLMTAIEKSKSIQSNSQVAKDALKVISDSYQELDKLTSTTRFSKLDPIVETDASIKGVFIIAGNAFLATSNDIYKASVLGGKPEKVATVSKNKGEIISGTILGDNIYLYTNDQTIMEFNPTSSQIDIAKLENGARWETANSISGFVGSLYLLDGVLGQIYKHSSSSDTFASGDNYLSASGGALKQAVSIAVDGSIYILKNDGQVLKYQKSKLQDFALKNTPTPYDKINDPRKIVTDSDTPSLYVLDSGQKRILQYDKDGFFVHQFALPENFDKISDFQVSIKSKRIWLANDAGLYEISI